MCQALVGYNGGGGVSSGSSGRKGSTDVFEESDKFMGSYSCEVIEVSDNFEYL